MEISHQTCPKNGQHFSTSSSSARNSTALTAALVTIHASEDVYIKLGNSTVTASSSDYDFHVLAGSYFYLRTNGATHIAAIRVSADGVFYINEER